MFSKIDFIEMIESEGSYKNVTINAHDKVFGTDEDGERCDLGYDSEILATLAEEGKLTQNQIASYNKFYRVNEDGNAQILTADEGDPVTRIDADVYPVGSDVSARYEHAEGIVLTITDAEKIGIESE